jgi:hypothetical protein
MRSPPLTGAATAHDDELFSALSGGDEPAPLEHRRSCAEHRAEGMRASRRDVGVEAVRAKPVDRFGDVVDR